jgi:uncharacterized protein DUF3501
MKQITRDAIISLSDYEKIRPTKQKEIIELKKMRRIAVGPHAMFYFENYDTIWYQIHEMLRIEKGGEAQIVDELDAYQPLIPNGQELVATVMFEINDKELRQEVLGNLGGIEYKAFIEVNGDTVYGIPEEDQERSQENGRTSSVHFIRFPLKPEMIKEFIHAKVLLGFNDERYGHMVLLSEEVKDCLHNDFL